MKIVDLLEYNLSPRQKQNALDNKATIIITMPPEIFFGLTNYSMEDTDHVTHRLKSKEQYQQWMDQEQITVHPFLDIDEKSGRVVGHEGRARAYAAMMAGDKQYEVAIHLKPLSRELSIKDVPTVWVGQYAQKYRINFRQLVSSGQIKVLNDNVQRQYQKNESIIEAYVFDKSGRMLDDEFNAVGIHPRCTNLTLKAFGICSNEILYNTLSIIKHLKEANYNILDLHLVRMTYDNIKGKEQEHTDEHGTFKTVPSPERPMTGKFAGKYYNWNKLKPYVDAYEFKKVSIAKFMRTSPNGRFVVGTRNHAMALIDGKLYDFENKGPNKRMLTQCYMILTDQELQSFMQDRPTFNAN